MLTPGGLVFLATSAPHLTLVLVSVKLYLKFAHSFVIFNWKVFVDPCCDESLPEKLIFVQQCHILHTRGLFHKRGPVDFVRIYFHKCVQNTSPAWAFAAITREEIIIFRVYGFGVAFLAVKSFLPWLQFVPRLP